MRKSFDAIVVRAAYPLVVLALCYWALFTSPVSTPVPLTDTPGAPTVDATREMVEHARELLRAENYQEALEPVKTLWAMDQTSHIYAKWLAEISQHLHKPQDEARYLEQMARLSPTPFEACPRLGEVYWEQGLPKESMDAYERCHKFDESDPDGVFYLARSYEWAERFDDAQKLYQHGLELDARYMDMRLGLARLQMRRGKTEDARARAIQILDEMPGNVDAMLIIGLSYQRDGNRREARKYLEQGLKLHESYADFHLALGILDEEDQRVTQALDHYTRTVALAPENHDAAVRRARLADRIKR